MTNSSRNWIYRYEVKGIQSWIMATDKLREMKGGSAIIERLGPCASERVERVGGTTHVAAAGGGWIEFPDRAALQAFVAEWPLVVGSMAPDLRLIQAWIPPGADLSVVHQRLAAARQALSARLPEVGPWVARSSHTGQPAVDREYGVLRDAATRSKDDEANADDTLGKRILGKDGRFVEDLERFGEGYLAVVHADGNRVGQKVRGFGADLAKLGAFSKKLGEATRAATSSAVQALKERSGEDRSGEIVARPIVLGGDDLTIIVRGEVGIPFSQTFLSAFQENCSSEPELSGLTASAGVAFVKRGFPFHSAYELSEALCKKAKKQHPHPGDSAIAFRRVTTASIGDDETLDLTRGAYKVNELRNLDELAGTLMELPRGSLRRWMASVVVDPERARLEWDRFEEVQHGKNPEQLSKLKEKLKGLESGREDKSPLGDALTWNVLQPVQGPATRLWEER